MSTRALRVAELIKREISIILQQDLRTPLEGLTSVTKVTLGPDLKHAKVFISILGSERQKAHNMLQIESAKGHIRYLLGKRVILRYVPALVFVSDDSIEHGMHISNIIDKLKEAERPGSEEETD